MSKIATAPLAFALATLAISAPTLAQCFPELTSRIGGEFHHLATIDSNRILVANGQALKIYNVSNAATIRDLTLADAGLYTCIATNSCGSTTSRIASLSFCPIDFNCDEFVDFFDYDDYVTCFSTGACPPGRTADFNNDNFIDFFDYDDFVAAFEEGC